MDIGLRMEYTLGVRNRYKYKKLLSTIFDPKELLVVSSSLNRALTSAQAQLEGMFPPLTGIELKDKELENSIPPIPMTETMKKEIENLGNNALPEKIQIVPIHIFNEKESIFGFDSCLINYQKFLAKNNLGHTIGINI